MSIEQADSPSGIMLHQSHGRLKLRDAVDGLLAHSARRAELPVGSH